MMKHDFLNEFMADGDLATKRRSLTFSTFGVFALYIIIIYYHIVHLISASLAVFT